MFSISTKKKLETYRQDLEYRRTLGPAEWDIINYHHNYRLGVIDNKTASLLQYNGIVVATLAILVASERNDLIVNTHWEIALFLVSFLLSIISIVTLLNSISLKWLVIHDQVGLQTLHESLLKSTIARTKVYIRALWFSRVAGIALAVLFLIVLARGNLYAIMAEGFREILGL